ncbi:hypothetical protein GUJ93_ZPchr0004g38644 [Zizania palustris]|uniref:Uncharacterized protein n=1 Tax=Zizania palustris TaxID=103762 RepID=A0A8J5S693_ZIZPA|nr:hypothetical protein GUJ93_ZPchr0004g38644 [Zizania palustris]
MDVSGVSSASSLESFVEQPHLSPAHPTSQNTAPQAASQLPGSPGAATGPQSPGSQSASAPVSPPAQVNIPPRLDALAPQSVPTPRFGSFIPGAEGMGPPGCLPPRPRPCGILLFRPWACGGAPGSRPGLGGLSLRLAVVGASSPRFLPLRNSSSFPGWTPPAPRFLFSKFSILQSSSVVYALMRCPPLFSSSDSDDATASSAPAEVGPPAASSVMALPAIDPTQVDVQSHSV